MFVVESSLGDTIREQNQSRIVLNKQQMNQIDNWEATICIWKQSEMNLLLWGLNLSTSNPAGSLIQVNGITCLSKTSRI